MSLIIFFFRRSVIFQVRSSRVVQAGCPGLQSTAAVPPVSHVFVPSASHGVPALTSHDARPPTNHGVTPGYHKVPPASNVVHPFPNPGGQHSSNNEDESSNTRSSTAGGGAVVGPNLGGLHLDHSTRSLNSSCVTNTNTGDQKQHPNILPARGSSLCDAKTPNHLKDFTNKTTPQTFCPPAPLPLPAAATVVEDSGQAQDSRYMAAATSCFTVYQEQKERTPNPTPETEFLTSPLSSVDEEADIAAAATTAAAVATAESSETTEAAATAGPSQFTESGSGKMLITPMLCVVIFNQLKLFSLH